MTDDQVDLIKLMQDFIAVDVLSGSALRNQERGVVRAVREHLARIRLQDVSAESEEAYRQWLDSRTDETLSGLTVTVPPWGSVRKALNLFMRACICNHYLRCKYALHRIEPLAEIPVDSIVAKALKQEAGWGGLPTWPGLKRLDSTTHLKFQHFAAEYARQLGFPVRVYLDNYLWLKNR